MLDECPCIVDDFSKTLLQSYPEGSLGEGEGLALLKALAHSTPVDTAHVERAHGRVSRLLRSQSVQTRAPTLSFLNAQQVCLKYKERVGFTATAKAGAVKKRVAAHSSGRRQQKAPAKAQKRGGGGSWRAFLSQIRRGVAGSSDFSQLKAQYDEIRTEGGERWRQLLEIGAAATELHKQTGLPSFGQPTRQIQRKLATRATQARLQAAGPAALVEVPDLLSSGTSAALADSFALANDIQNIRKQTREAGKQRRLSRERKMEALERFVAERKGSTLEASFQVVPELIQFADSVHLEPFNDFMLLQIAFQNIDKAERPCILGYVAQSNLQPAKSSRRGMAGQQRSGAAQRSSASGRPGGAERTQGMWDIWSSAVHLSWAEDLPH